MVTERSPVTVCSSWLAPSSMPMASSMLVSRTEMVARMLGSTSRSKTKFRPDTLLMKSNTARSGASRNSSVTGLR
ncbi:hypothetical protein [Rugamonas sp. DEMB1]|uniref:hypothetical protein n=1 Tax=Rugamonas sp. DEMB1 TaxID=3039386 RepID=UPI00244B38A0|nr:hypothetical protein [Rugamonas sp. DEMB1]WGG51147.1 hypothetical protein QC826_02325 [Rugamonas sp. DEMB1]